MDKMHRGLYNNVGGQSMSDLIDRQAAIDEFEKHRALFCDHTPETFRCLPYDEKCRVERGEE